MTPPLIYNLFQRLVGPTTRWPEHAQRAREMGFNWLYLNPWHYPGFSGSLYAPKELDRMNPLFLPSGTDERSLEPLRDFLAMMNQAGMPVMMDLVVNHTSKDSPLIEQHPDWFVRDEHGEVVSPFVVDPDDPSRKTVWGDLAEVDNASSPDREALWSFWGELVRGSLEMGFSGFRCDAAYKVPAPLWRYLIEEARRVNPHAQFFAETLGAPVDEVLALREAGFDYIFNSSKWWDLREPWAMEQHEQFREIAPSISFPETHDTTRLAADTGGDEAIQRQRYAFAAAFSAGLMMPIGYEFGFRKQVNVVETMPSDWERTWFDLRAFITRVNALKLTHPLLQGEGKLRMHEGGGDNVLLLERQVDGVGTGWIAVNRGPHEAVLRPPAELDSSLRVCRLCAEHSADGGEPLTEEIVLQRAEVIYLLPRVNA